MNVKLKWILVLMSMMLLLGISCSDSGNVRKYTEEEKAPATPVEPATAAVMPPHGHGAESAMTPTAPAIQAHFKWDTPAGWESQAQTSSFRLATFGVKAASDEALCTIIPLQGEAGGLEANVIRWMEQIGIKPENSAPLLKKAMENREDFKTVGGYSATLIDLTAVTDKPEDQSILSTVITVDGNSVFIKMTGKKSLLLENKDKFKGLCLSFAASNPEPES